MRDESLILLGQRRGGGRHALTRPLRDAQRVRRARPVPRPRPGAPDATTSGWTRRTWPSRTSGSRRPRSPGCSTPRPRESGRDGLRAPARRAASALHAGSAERGAARGARPAQRPDAPAALRAQLQRGAPHAPGRVGRTGHDAAVVRVRRARPGASRRWRWASRRCTASSASASGRTWRAAVGLLPAPRARQTSRRTTGSSARGCSSSTSSPAWCFYASDLDAPNALSDPLMRPYAQQFLDSLVSPRATTLLGPGAGAGGVPAAARASARWTRSPARSAWTAGPCTAISPREDESFSSIVHATRAGLAERHLANDRYSMTEVSAAARVRGAERLLPVVPAAVRRQPDRVAEQAWRREVRARLRRFRAPGPARLRRVVLGDHSPDVEDARTAVPAGVGGAAYLRKAARAGSHTWLTERSLTTGTGR